MIDFHSHFLPGVDDGSDSVQTSLEMLRESWRQGVRLMFATPHFYADEDDPQSFLERREQAYRLLCRGMELDGGEFPEIMLGAEILYFPGISVADEMAQLSMGDTPFLLIEPPMMPWRNSMLDEIEQLGENLQRIPVIAHVDRYMRMLRDDTLFDRLEGRRMLAQVNASFFLYRDSIPRALYYLRQERIQFVGSDCHNMDEREPNMGPAEEVIRMNGASGYFDAIQDRLYELLDEVENGQ